MKNLKLSLIALVLCSGACYADHIMPDGRGGYFTSDGYIQSDGNGGYFTPDGYIQPDGNGGYFTP